MTPVSAPSRTPGDRALSAFGQTSGVIVSSPLPE